MIYKRFQMCAGRLEADWSSLKLGVEMTCVLERVICIGSNISLLRRHFKWYVFNIV